MPKRLFIGGPWGGMVEDLPDGETAWRVDDPDGGVWIYLATRFAAGESVVTLFVNGLPSTERIFHALLAAAGLEADR